MSEQQYNIVYRGDIVFGHQLSDVKLRLQQLFKTDEAKINALFTGKPVVLKRNLDMATAETYRAALLNAGARVDIVADDAKLSTSSVSSPATSSPVVQPAVNVRAAPASSPSPETASAQKVSSTQTVENWSLAPAGVNLLEANQQHPFVPRNIDTSGLALKPAGGNLLDANELQPSVPGVAVPNFELANVGADLVRADEKLVIPAAEINAGEWGVAEVGADLISDDEKEIVLPALINIPDVGLAPAGADLGQIKPQVKPVVPDISGLHLVD